MVVVEAQGDVHRLVAFVNARKGGAAEQGLDRARELGQRQSVLRQHLPTRNDLQLGRLHLLLYVEVGHAFYVLDSFLNFLSERIHRLQVGAEKLDGDVGLRARKHRVDAVGDGCPDFHAHSGQLRQPLTDVGHDFVLAAIGKMEGGFNLRSVDAQGMFVELGTSGFAPGGNDFGHLQQQFLGLASDAVRRFERNAGQRVDVDRKRALVEGGQETASETEEQEQAGHKEQQRRA